MEDIKEYIYIYIYYNIYINIYIYTHTHGPYVEGTSAIRYSWPMCRLVHRTDVQAPPIICIYEKPSWFSQWHDENPVQEERSGSAGFQRGRGCFTEPC